VLISDFISISRITKGLFDYNTLMNMDMNTYMIIVNQVNKIIETENKKIKEMESNFK